MSRVLFASLAAAALAMTVSPAQASTVVGDCPEGHISYEQPIVVGHRGASGYRPEHTLASYRLAAEMGADYIEPDLVATKDGVLVARHENEISGTTDVADRPEFADRKATKSIDGSEITGWFTEDFTLAELKTLKAKERLPQVRPENTKYDGEFEVPTFAEVLELRAQLSEELGREIGVYPETKHPTYFQSIDLNLEAPLVADLEAAGLNRRNAPVFVQSFEVQNLRDLETVHGLNTPTVFLIWKNGAPFDNVAAGKADRDFAWYTTELGMMTLMSYGIDGVGPEMSLVISWNEDGTLGEETGLVDLAHRYGMDVHAYTYRAENTFLPKDFQSSEVPTEHGDVEGLIKRYLDAGLDGFFTDHADKGVAARNAWVKASK